MPSPQASAAPSGDGRATSDQGEPASASVAGDGPESAVLAYVDGLDGAERKILLNQIARTFPDVVEAGAGLVAQWRAESAERRRKKGKRHEHERRRRRAEEGNLS